MKKGLFLALGLFALAVLAANAQQGGFSGSHGAQAEQGGFRGPSNVSTVAEALTFRDDAPVILRGNIIRSLGNKRYLFSDSTGTITIEIERKVWGPISVDENDLVEISGEIDRDWNSIEVEVNRIRQLYQGDKAPVKRIGFYQL